MTEYIQYIFLIIIAFSALLLLLWSSDTLSGTEKFTNSQSQDNESFARVKGAGLPYYYPYFPYKEMLWNNPTRMESYYWPYLYYDPLYYPWYYTYPYWQ